MSERVWLRHDLGIVSIDVCDPDGSSYKYVDEDGCPACESDLEIFIRETSEHYDYEWKGFAERCVEYGEGCEHRI